MRTKDEYEELSRGYVSAFQDCAMTLGKTHQLTIFMGGLAWGRHGAERGPDQTTTRDVVAEYGFLCGCLNMMVKFCNMIGDIKAMRVLNGAVSDRLGNSR